MRTKQRSGQCRVPRASLLLTLTTIILFSCSQQSLAQQRDGDATNADSNSSSASNGRVNFNIIQLMSGEYLEMFGAGTSRGILRGHPTISGIELGSLSADPLMFSTNSVERMRIMPNGFIGIGTTSPKTKLDIKQSEDTFVGGLHLRRSSTNDTWALATGLDNSLYMGYANDASGADAGSDFTVYPLVLTGSGKVGIGTTSPGYKLDVAGQIRSSSGGFVFPDGTVQTTAAGGGGGGSQWTTTSGTNNISYNSGNVGIGTATPSSALDVAGVSKSQAFNVGGFSAEKGFSLLWSNAVANQKVQVYWPASTQVDGIYEITVTGHYWFSNSNGGIRKRIVINGRDIGIINMEESEVPFRMGYTGNSNTISNIMWDAANSRYYFIVSNLDNAQNAITIHVKSITPGATPANADNLNITPIYTTDATSYPQLFTSFMSSNVGVGTNTPAYKLDVNGEVNATGFRINGTPISTGGGGAVSSVFGRTGAVVQQAGDYTWAQINKSTSSLADIATRSAGDLSSGTLPDARFPTTLPAVSGANLTTLNASNLANGTVPIARLGSGTADSTKFLRGDNTWAVPSGTSQWTTSGTTISYSSGNVGIGTTASPTEKLEVIGNIKVSGNINAKYQDVAEWVDSSQELVAGTVVVLDSSRSNHVIAATQSYDSRIAGVISLQPGLTLGEEAEGRVLVATTGRVRVKVDATEGAIQIGDLLVTSNREGFAMKSLPVNVGGVRMHRPGTLIGKALEPLAKGTGEILVLLSLQ